LQVPMQNPFHSYKSMMCAALLPFLASPSVTLANSPLLGPGGEKTSDLRLIAAENAPGGVFHAGIEITLKPGALTYWRQPGDAGVPPVFSFDGSDNLAKAEVFYPAPTRIKEDEGEAFGYRDKVVFPLHVTPRDKTKPVVLKLTADYAVCERICIPAKSHVEISLPLAHGDSQEAAISEAEARVPRRLSADEIAGKLTLVPEKNTGTPAWRLTWKDPVPWSDLFAEAPEGWYFETLKVALPNEFRIIAVDAPTKDGAAPPVTLTLTGPQQSFEFTLPLDATPAGR
jgi:DsbC/DsbD-like thiol-disulfide interchange protein